MHSRIFYILRFEIIPSIFYPLVRKHVYTIRHGLAKGLKRRGGLGFIPRIKRVNPEASFLMNLDLSGQIVYDIGAAYGIFTLFFTRMVGTNGRGRVFAFEPNPQLSKQIIENAALNCFDNVNVLQIALGKETKRDTLAYPSGELGIGSLEKHERARILTLKKANAVEVQVDSIDHLVAAKNLPKPDFVKIDTQAAELDILLGMSKMISEHKPKIFVEIHSIPYINWKMNSTMRILEFLIMSDTG